MLPEEAINATTLNTLMHLVAAIHSELLPEVKLPMCLLLKNPFLSLHAYAYGSNKVEQIILYGKLQKSIPACRRQPENTAEKYQRLFALLENHLG